MPEGPEIRHIADQLQQAIGDEDCVEISFAFEHLKVFEAELTGQRVQGVTSQGKALLTRFSGGWTIYSHNQLYGRWMVRKAYQYPDTSKQLRLAIHTRRKSALLYSASDIEVIRTEEEHKHPFLKKLGPDVLDDSCRVEDVRKRLDLPEFRQKQLGTLLLDQGFLAGLGNYLRSEVLFLAGLQPHLKPRQCDPVQLNLLAQACVGVTRQSYRTNGITNDLKLAEALKQQGVPRAHFRHWVFARAGRPCWKCQAPIERTSSGSRRLYFCPNCQRLPA